MTRTKAQLTELKNDLLTMKKNLENEEPMEDSLENNTNETSVTDNHLADSATEYVDRQTEIAEHNLNEEQLTEVNEALERMENGTYGICVDTGEKISFERLKAIPYAKRTLQAEEKHRNDIPANEDEDTTRMLKPEGEMEDARERTLEKIENEHNSAAKPDEKSVYNEKPNDVTHW